MALEAVPMFTADCELSLPAGVPDWSVLPSPAAVAPFGLAVAAVHCVAAAAAVAAAVVAAGPGVDRALLDTVPD